MRFSIKNIDNVNLLNILHVLNDGFIVSLPLLLPFIKEDLHLDLIQIGFLGSVLNLLGIFLALPAGIIATKLGGLRSLTWAIGLYSLGFIATSISPNYWFVVIAFLIAGTGFGIFHPIAFASVAKWAQKERLGKAMGNFTAIGDLGRVGVSAGVTFFASYIGWRLTSGIYGAVALGIFALLITFSQKDNVKVKQSDEKSVSLLYFLKHKSFLTVSLTGFLDSFASSSLFVFIPFLLLSKGVNPAILGTFTGFFFIGNFLGKSLLGRFVDKFGNTKVFITAEFFMAVNIILFALSQNWIAIIIIAVILGALTKGTVPVIQTMLAEATEKEHSYEKVFALNSLIVGIATASAPLIFGIIANKFGVIHVFSVSACFALLAIITAIIARRTFDSKSKKL
ncbi:MAG: MFS transporter [Candidatus Shapirobacteria bacterium]